MGCDISFLKKGKGLGVENGADGVSHEKRILLLGLDNAGKTSILFQMRDKEFKDTVPTVGLNIEHILYKRYSLTMWDVGGQATKLWKHYFDHINGIIFVIDSTDEEKLLFASEELNRIMRDESLTGVPILMFYNKSDKEAQCKSKEELNTRLQIDEISISREISIQNCSALNGSGILEGLDKLIAMFEERKDNNGKGGGGLTPTQQENATTSHKESKAVNE